MEFDLSLYEAQESAVLEVKTPQGKPLLGEAGKPVRIHLHGPGSSAYQKAQAKYDRAVQTAAFEALRNQGRDDQEDGRSLQAERLAACTVRIENFPVEPLALYSNPKLGYITNQAVRFGEAWANFLPQFAKD